MQAFTCWRVKLAFYFRKNEVQIVGEDKLSPSPIFRTLIELLARSISSQARWTGLARSINIQPDYPKDQAPMFFFF